MWLRASIINPSAYSLCLLPAFKQFPDYKIAPKIYYGRSMELINDNEYELAEKYLDEISKFRSSTYFAPAIFWKAGTQKGPTFHF